MSVQVTDPNDNFIALRMTIASMCDIISKTPNIYEGFNIIIADINYTTFSLKNDFDLRTFLENITNSKGDIVTFSIFRGEGKMFGEDMKFFTVELLEKQIKDEYRVLLKMYPNPKDFVDTILNYIKLSNHEFE